MNESVTSMASNADNAKPDSSLNLVPQQSEAPQSAVGEPESAMKVNDGDPLGQTGASLFNKTDMTGADHSAG